MSARTWLVERAGARDLVDALSHKTVPRHRWSFAYYLGGMALFLFAIQLGTGLLLLLYYEPGAATAHESVRAIAGEIPFGWLVRSMHRWSADLMVGVLALHALTAYFMKAYRAPRELTWMTGVLLLAITLAFGFSGYLLPWDDVAYFATAVGTASAGAFPVVGGTVLSLLRGGEDVTGATLARFFALHVVVLPLAGAGVLVLHLALVQKHGMSVPPRVVERGPPRPFFPDFLLRDAAGWTLALAALAALAASFPAHLGPRADPFASAPPGIRPEWYFLAPFETLRRTPPRIGPFEGETVVVTSLALLGVLWFFVPFLDRRAARGERSPAFTAAGVLGAAWVLVMTWLALR